MFKVSIKPEKNEWDFLSGTFIIDSHSKVIAGQLQAENAVLALKGQQILSSWQGNIRKLDYFRKKALETATSQNFFEVTMAGGKICQQRVEFSAMEDSICSIQVRPIELLNLESCAEQLDLGQIIHSHIQDAILVTQAEGIDDPEPKVIYVNEAFTRMSGHEPTDIIGKTPRILQGPDTNKQSRDFIRRSIADWKPFRTRLLNYKKDGTPFLVEIDVTPIRSKSGWYTSWISVQRDVTREVEQAEQQKRMAKLVSLGEMAGGTFHEISTPLGSAFLGMRKLKKSVLKPGGEKDVQKSIELLERSLERINKTVIAIRDFGREGIEEELVDVGYLSDELTTLLLPRIKEKSIQLQFLGFTQGLKLKFSRMCVEHGLLNLISNAIDASEEGSKVEVELIEENGSHSFTVKDWGAGVDEKDCEKIFEFSFSTKPRSDKAGMGFGLSFARSLVQQMGGEIRITQLSHPTTFRLDLTYQEEGKAPKVAG